MVKKGGIELYNLGVQGMFLRRFQRLSQIKN